MIDSEGFRANVGIVLTNQSGRVFLAKRVNQAAWQFPQGGVNKGEQAEQAMYRELYEEVGLKPEHVKVLAVTDKWLRYRLPEKYIRHTQRPLCVGQKQKWFLLRLVVDDKYIDLNKTRSPEFDGWQWTFYWAPVKKVISFKRRVYVKALKLLRPFLKET